MANLPESWFVDPTGAGLSSNAGETNPRPIDVNLCTPEQLVVLLRLPHYREQALSAIRKVQQRGACLELHQTLWNSFETVYILLQEVTAIYTLLSPSKLTMKDCGRVCNAIALLQRSQIGIFKKIKGSDHLKSIALPNGFLEIRSLVESDLRRVAMEVVAEGSFGKLEKLRQHGGMREIGLECLAADPYTRMELIRAKIPVYLYPLLNTTEKGKPFEHLRITGLTVLSALVKVATYIVSRILMQKEGLKYCCDSADRACHALNRCLPTKLRDRSLLQVLHGHPGAMSMLAELFFKVQSVKWNKPPEGDSSS
ncbi:unnamed protein product [Ilex paraguariensis]|uniref:Uncharacterized protein n=1 Tax=Ilex paraguariensis TaxID=185542 RepID=A0ABC8RV93_9AQUA